MTAPLRDRFGIEEKLDYYSPDELAVIIRRSAGIIGVEISEDAAGIISHRSRSTPRIANRLLARVRDYAVSRASGVIDPEVANEALRVFEVDDLGLDKVDRAILESIVDKFGGGPVGLSTLAIAVGEEPETVEDAYEPFLLQSGLIKRTPRAAWPPLAPIPTSARNRPQIPRGRLSSLHLDEGRGLQVPTPGVGHRPGGDRAPPRLPTPRHTRHVRSSLPRPAHVARPGDLVVVNRDPGPGSPALRPPKGHRRCGGVARARARPDGLWEALARPSRRLRPGIVIEIEASRPRSWTAPTKGWSWSTLEAADVEAAIANAGNVPLPPYFHGTLDDPDRYQTMFARSTGSAAAPTAGLHFTAEVRPVCGSERSRSPPSTSTSESTPFDRSPPTNIEEHVMHTEWCSIPESTAAAIDTARARGGRVVAVGTTVVRTLETFADRAGTVKAGEHETSPLPRPRRRVPGG